MVADVDERYKLHAAALFRFAVRCVGRRDIAEELTGDAFLSVTFPWLM